jgi:glycosyltransferase involved in cell wall biosynthesis
VLCVDENLVMRIAFLTASISRNAGGLYDATRLLARQLSQEGTLSVSVVGLMDEWTTDDHKGWLGLDVHAASVRGPRSLGYAPAMRVALDNRVLDVLHTHGLWMYPSIASLMWVRRHGRPYIVSPHGMLDKWALNNSYWKKRAARLLYEDAHLRGANCLHALCLAEYEAIRGFGLKNPVCVIPNGINLPDRQTIPPPAWRKRVPENNRILLYLGRLHPKKGLASLLRAWRRAYACAEAKSWALVIAGWDQGGHEAELKELANNFGIRSVYFVGPQFEEAKQASYACADAFVLPSISEGLPMTVLEAWSYRLPVMITPACNLPEAFDVGTSIQIEPIEESIAEGLAKLFRMDNGSRIEMGQRGYELAAQRFSWPRIAQEMMTVYRWVLGKGTKPDCVQID